MAMQQIGIPARKVIADIEAKHADAAKIAPQEFVAPPPDREDAIEGPAQDMPAHPVCSVEGMAATELDEEGKMAEAAEAPAKFPGLSNRRLEVEATVTSLPTTGRSMIAVSRRKQRHPPASAAVIDLPAWKQGHAPTLP